MHNVTLLLTDADGTPLGSSDQLPIRSAQVSNVIWVIMGAGVLLLFVAILLRLVRRIRGRHDHPGEDTEVAETAAVDVTTADDDRVLASSAVMAAGTVVSRLSGFVRSTLLVAALGVSLHADVFTIANTIPNMLYILLAGGVFNAVLVPAAGPGDAQRRRRRRGLHQPGDHAGRHVPRRGHGGAGDRGAAGDGGDAQQPVRRGGPGRAATVGDRLRSVLPSAGLLLRDVRAGRPDPQLTRPLRPDDVGADRQQRDRDRGAGRLPHLVRPGQPGRAGRPVRHRSGAAARPRLDGRHRRAAADPAALPARRGLPLPAALRLPAHRPRPHVQAGHLDGAVRDRQPGGVRRRGPAGLRRNRRAAATAPASRSTPTRS